MDIRDKWQQTIDDRRDKIDLEMARALESSQSVVYGFVMIKKDRRGGYFIKNLRWNEILDVIKVMGGVGPAHRDMANSKTEV